MSKVTKQWQEFNHDSIAGAMRTGCFKFGEEEGCPPGPQGMGLEDVIEPLVQIWGERLELASGDWKAPWRENILLEGQRRRHPSGTQHGRGRGI